MTTQYCTSVHWRSYIYSESCLAHKCLTCGSSCLTLKEFRISPEMKTPLVWWDSFYSSDFTLIRARQFCSFSTFYYFYSIPKTTWGDFSKLSVRLLCAALYKSWEKRCRRCEVGSWVLAVWCWAVTFHFALKVKEKLCANWCFVGRLKS